MNTIVIQGLRIDTPAKYVKFSKSETTKAVYNIKSSVFEILFRQCRKSSDIVSKYVKILKDQILEESEYLEIKNPIFRINGFFFKKIVNQSFTFTQVIVSDIENFLVYRNSTELIVLIPAKRLKDFKGYVKAINCSNMLEYIKGDQCVSLTNISSILLSDKSFCINSKNLTIQNSAEHYSKYILKGVDVIYEYLQGLKRILNEFGMDLLGYPIDQTLTTRNYIRWKLTDKDKHIQRKTNQDLLHHAVLCRTVMEMQVSIADMEMYEDFIFKYQHYRLITNYTEWYVKDKLGTRWLCSAQYEPIQTTFDTEQAQNADGNFSFSTTFNVNLFYYIVEDYQAYKIFGYLGKIVAKSTDPLDESIIKI